MRSSYTEVTHLHETNIDETAFVEAIFIDLMDDKKLMFDTLYRDIGQNTSGEEASGCDAACHELTFLFKKSWKMGAKMSSSY